jgi:hypothetical protein
MLSFWKSKSRNYPGLAHLARDILCVQPTSVQIERTWCFARLIYNWNRSIISPAVFKDQLMISAFLRTSDLDQGDPDVLWDHEDEDQVGPSKLHRLEELQEALRVGCFDTLRCDVSVLLPDGNQMGSLENEALPTRPATDVINPGVVRDTDTPGLSQIQLQGPPKRGRKGQHKDLPARKHQRTRSRPQPRTRLTLDIPAESGNDSALSTIEVLGALKGSVADGTNDEESESELSEEGPSPSSPLDGRGGRNV